MSKAQDLFRIAVVLALFLASAAYGALGLYNVYHPNSPRNAGQKVTGADFAIYYAAARLTLEGRPGAVYEPETFYAAQYKYGGGRFGVLKWHYPPHALLLFAHLGVYSYATALILWLVGGLLVYALAAFVLRPDPHGLLLALLFPAALNSLLAGQNGCLSAALLIGGLLLAQARPLVAGLLLALLSYKPHLGLLVLFALIAGGHWRCFWTATAGTAALVALSMAVWGVGLWQAFIADILATDEVLNAGAALWQKMPTLFASLKLAGLADTAAWPAQIVASLAAIGVTIFAWRRHGPIRYKVAIVCLVTPLATPYALFYDLALLLAPLVLFVGTPWRRETPTPQQVAGLALWIAPLALWWLALAVDVALWPLLLAILALFAWREQGRAPAVSR